MADWEISEEDGQHVVTKGRTRRTFDTAEQAQDFVKKRRRKTEKVVRIGEDGYRVPVTRRHWRRPGMDL